MNQLPGNVTERSVTVHMTGALCTQPAQILHTWQTRGVIQNFLNELRRRQSVELRVLDGLQIEGTPYALSEGAEQLARLLALLVDLSCDDVRAKAPDLAALVDDPSSMARLVDRLYDYWRSYERYLIFEGAADESRNRAIEGHTPFIHNNHDLNVLVAEAYRRIARNLRGYWPRVYREVPAGANMSLLIDRIAWDCPGGEYEHLRDIPMVRLALITLPLVLHPRCNSRKGSFEWVDFNPARMTHLDPVRWLCMPMRVGDLLVLFYVDRDYMALATSLINLFELADHDDARVKPDGIMLFGVPPAIMQDKSVVFHVDEQEDIVVGAVAHAEDVDYFGYCKKPMLTIHNVAMMRRGRLPVHGAMCHIRLQGGPSTSLVIVGDSGAGKSETIEAFRTLADEWLSDMTIIFDDMGSLAIGEDGVLRGYGTEIGAFVRLDDLDPGYAFGQFDRSIFMNPDRTNARVVIPVTPYDQVVAGYPVDMLLYANNYESVTDEAPAFEPFDSADDALDVFRAGRRAAKGTTDEKGLVETYFSNPFGPAQMRDMHEPLARRHFEAAFAAGLPVGQVRTRLGLDGWEQDGPREAAEALFRFIRERAE